MKINQFIYLSIFIAILSGCREESIDVDFIMSRSEANVYETIYFTNQSDEVNSYKWDFGDGETSTEDNPEHIYKDGGKYQVTLIAFGNNIKTQETKSKTVTIQELATLHLTIYAVYGNTINKDYRLDSATISLYESYDDYKNMTNKVASGTTDKDGEVYFHNLDSVKYWISVYRKGYTTGYYSNRIEGKYVTTNALYLDSINSYFVYAHYYEQKKKDASEINYSLVIKNDKNEKITMKTIKKEEYIRKEKEVKLMD